MNYQRQLNFPSLQYRQIEAVRVYLCQVADNSVCSRMAGDAPPLWDGSSLTPIIIICSICILQTAGVTATLGRVAMTWLLVTACVSLAATCRLVTNVNSVSTSTMSTRHRTAPIPPAITVRRILKWSLHTKKRSQKFAIASWVNKKAQLSIW